MPKVLAETTGDFQLQDEKLQHLPAFRPAVVVMNHSLQRHLGNSQLRILIADLNDEATDAEFVKYLGESEGDRELAIASFASAFSTQPVVPRAEDEPTEAQVRKSKAR